MCNRYTTPEESEIERFWRLDAKGWERRVRKNGIFPRMDGPFIRRAKDDAGYTKELVHGRWGLIPWFSKTADVKYNTNNARCEELLEKASYKEPWLRGQRCIIPALEFDEPNWETGRNILWRFRRTDGAPWGLAGLWNTWKDSASGELFESYTMLTINADSHPLMSRMHKPDPKLPVDQQDKRSVIPIELEDVDQWLAGTVAEAKALLKLAPVEEFDAAPEVN